jgi:beta-lactamase regulating signal transducer with metallopeptidase domain/uncharacterized membrane protein YkoI
MRTFTELLLNFIVNGCWQILAIALVASLADRLLRRAVRYRHLLWVVALVMSLLLPLLSSVHFPRNPDFASRARQATTIESVPLVDASRSGGQAVAINGNSFIHINRRLAVGLLAIYLLFLSFQILKLFRAWLSTRAMKQRALRLEIAESLGSIAANCQEAFGVKRFSLFSSSSLDVPAALGIFHPLVILPDALLRERDTAALTAAIGHELVHVWRHDYLLNLIYEVIFLPLSFHPAAALMKRRITQTRELRCDELVAERLLRPEVYARSLVQLAGLAIPFVRRTQTISVGIADADILEVRIMSLLKKSRSNMRRSALLLVFAALLLAIPCVVAASYAVHLNLAPAPSELSTQRPSSMQEQNVAREKEQRERAEVQAREDREFKERIEKETNPEVKAKLEEEFKARLQSRAKRELSMTGANDQQYRVKLDDEARAREEQEIKARRNAELARLARINMDQAIQIATSQVPGKVLASTLVGEHWEEPGKLAKDAQVMYHIVILSGEGTNATTTHVLVNALDGSIVKSEREVTRQRKEEPQK